MLRFCFLFPFFCLAALSPEDRLMQMSLEEKIGQLIVAPAAPLRGGDHWQDWEHLLSTYHIGHALLKASDSVSQIAFVQKLQHSSPLPLLILADAEWGLGMRMHGAISFPKNLTLGSVQDLSLLERMGEAVGRQAAKVGVHLNLAPVADINSNPLNPIIHMRSFGEDPHSTSKRVQALVRGMRKEGLFTCAKHFPGHGNTFLDSHQALPILQESLEELRRVELLPFRAAIEEGVECIMSGHLLFPSLDSWPTSLSSRCMKELLRGELQFQGVAITDALNMRALTTTWSVEEIAIKAFEAGHHLLLYGAHLNEDVDELMRDQIPRACQALNLAFSEGRLDKDELDQRVLAILALKERRKESAYSPEIVEKEDLALKRELFRSALTLRGKLPAHIQGYLAIHGKETDWIVQKMREQGIAVHCTEPGEEIDLSHTSDWLVGLHRAGQVSDGFGLDEKTLGLLKGRDLVILFCTPYALQLFSSEQQVLIAYENNADAGEAVWDALQGDLVPFGRCPVLLRVQEDLGPQ